MTRGIPSGYISSLEKRLAETEVALFQALRDDQAVPVGASTGTIKHSESLLAKLEEHNAIQTRGTKQAAWARQPVSDHETQGQWLREMDTILGIPREEVYEDPGVASSNVSRETAGSTTRLTPATPLEAGPPTQSVQSTENEGPTHNVEFRAPTTAVRRVESTSSPSKRPKTAATTANRLDDVLRSEVGVMRRSSANNAASFVGSASGIQFVRAVYNAMAKRSHGNPTYAQMADGVPAEDDHLSGPDVRCLWQEHETTSSFSTTASNVGQSLLSDLLAWSQSYFENWQPAYPFLEVSDVLEWFKKIAFGHNVSEDHRLAKYRMVVIRSVMSISLADRRQSASRNFSTVPSQLVFDSFGAALESVQTVLVEPPSLESLQAVMSVQLFFISMLRHNAASRLGGLVTRMIFQMGLHRCPARYATFSVSEISLRQRIFYAAYTVDRHICQSLGLPLTLRDDDIDVCRCGHEQHRSSATELPVNQGKSTLPDFLARHGEIVGLVMELRNKSISYRQADTEQATRCSTKIAKWSNDVDGFLDSEEAYALSDFHHTVLTVLKGESIIALNRPLLATKVKPDYDAALHACISAARSIIATLHRYLLKISSTVSEGRDEVTPLAWPSFTWSVWMSAFIALYAALEDEMQRSVAAR